MDVKAAEFGGRVKVVMKGDGAIKSYLPEELERVVVSEEENEAATKKTKVADANKRLRNGRNGTTNGARHQTCSLGDVTAIAEALHTRMDQQVGMFFCPRAELRLTPIRPHPSARLLQFENLEQSFARRIGALAAAQQAALLNPVRP